jgi:hypothetical protein
MRVQIVGSRGCKVSRSVRNTLETVIAEERLPIPVEMVENEQEDSSPPTIRIDGDEVHHNSALHTLEHLRDLLCGRWHELTSASLHHT